MIKYYAIYLGIVLVSIVHQEIVIQYAAECQAVASLGILVTMKLFLNSFSDASLRYSASCHAMHRF